MADRYTKKDVENAFRYFVEAVGGKLAKGYNDVGGLALDHNSVYGGYTIVQIVNKGGGQSQPFGYGRLRAGDFIRCMNFAMQALHYKKYGR